MEKKRKRPNDDRCTLLRPITSIDELMRVSGARQKSTPPCLNHHPQVSGRYEIVIQPRAALAAPAWEGQTTIRASRRPARFLSVKRSYSHIATKKGGDVTKPIFVLVAI